MHLQGDTLCVRLILEPGEGAIGRGLWRSGVVPGGGVHCRGHSAEAVAHHGCCGWGRPQEAACCEGKGRQLGQPHRHRHLHRGLGGSQVRQRWRQRTLGGGLSSRRWHGHPGDGHRHRPGHRFGGHRRGWGRAAHHTRCRPGLRRSGRWRSFPPLLHRRRGRGSVACRRSGGHKGHGRRLVPSPTSSVPRGIAPWGCL